MTLLDLIRNGGDPLGYRTIWIPEARNAILGLAERASRDATAQGLEPLEAVRATMLGLYAHGYLVGHKHARSGELPPRLIGLTEDDVPTIVIPDDIKDL